VQSKESALTDTSRHADVEKRVLLEKIRSLESRDSSSSSRLSELASELGAVKAQLAAVSEEKFSLTLTLDQQRQHSNGVEEQVSCEPSPPPPPPPSHPPIPVVSCAHLAVVRRRALPRTVRVVILWLCVARGAGTATCFRR
jgi:hypothetical protein